MADFEDLVRQNKDEIHSQLKDMGRNGQTQISRDPARRPWHEDTLKSPIHNKDFLETNEKTLPWYASFSGLGAAIRNNLKASLFAGLLAAALLFGLSKLVVSSYNSVLHLYAPDKIDSIVSRMTLLTNQVEFASLPIEFRVPVSLLSRSLREGEARQWVLGELAKDPQIASGELPLVPDSVRAETFYASGAELLVIQGYASHPEVALKVTHLYWKYLEDRLSEIRHSYFKRIDNWIQIRSENLARDIHDYRETLAKSMAQLGGTDGASPLQQRLRNDLADIEMKRLNFEKEIGLLESAVAFNGGDELKKINDPEIQRLADIYFAVQQGTEPGFRDRASSIETEIKKAIEQRLEQRKIQLQSLLQDRARFSRQLNGFRSVDGRQQMDSQNVRDLQQRLQTLESQGRDLDKLKGQIALESTLGSATLKAVQLPFADSATLNPKPILVAFVIGFGALLVALFTAIGLQFARTGAVKPNTNSRSRPSATANPCPQS